PEPELVKQAITISRTTNRQLQRDLNTCFYDDHCPELKGWELFIQENVFIVLGNMDHVNACTTFTYHERVINPLDSSRKTIKDKGKRAAPPSSSSSSSSSDKKEEPSLLEFYEELSDNMDLTDAQKEKREMFKCLNCYFDTITKYLKKQK
ncbi:hypothetical protein Tco_0347657, partial [Tanacetum coccineum]